MKPFRFLRTPLTRALAQRRLLSCAALSSFALLTAPQAGAVMMDIGNLPGNSAPHVVTAISGDGKVVGGKVGRGLPTLFTWRADQGFQDLGAFLTTLESGISGINSDGSVLVGTTYSKSIASTAFRWTATTGFTELGALGTGSTSQSTGVSDDGEVVVGYSTLNLERGSQAFRWANGTMKGLDYLAGTSGSQAYGVSGDGNVTVGKSESTAVKWDAAGAVTSLGTQGQANAANRDGSVIVGKGASTAFRWTAATGAQSLGTLGGSSSEATDVNASGSVVVGGANQADGTRRAFRWTANAGMVNLGVLSGQSTSSASGVSDDGKTVVGTSGDRSFIWTASASDDALQDLENLQLSQITSASTLGQLTAAQNRRMRDLNQQHCIPTDAQQYCLSGGFGTYRGEGDSNGSQLIGQATAGLRINEQFAVGASVNLGQADLKTNSAKQDNAYGLALWGTYQQQPNAQGWVGSASVGMGHSRDTFERGVGLTDVQRAQSRTQMNSTGVRVAVGYGVQVGSSLVTPEVALSHARTHSDGFTERNVAFPLTLNAASSDETYATFGVRSETPLTPKTTLHLGAAVDALLSDNTDPIEGRSAVPGLGRFQLRSNLDKRDLVPVANAGVSYALSANSTVSGQVQVGASTYEQQSAVYGVGMQYRYAF